MHGIKVLMAKNYIDNLSEEARKGMQEKAEQGIWPTKTPLGYRNITGSDGRKIIAADPAVAPIARSSAAWEIAVAKPAQQADCELPLRLSQRRVSVASGAQADLVVSCASRRPVPTVLIPRCHAAELGAPRRRPRVGNDLPSHLQMPRRTGRLVLL